MFEEHNLKNIHLLYGCCQLKNIRFDLGVFSHWLFKLIFYFFFFIFPFPSFSFFLTFSLINGYCCWFYYLICGQPRRSNHPLKLLLDYHRLLMNIGFCRKSFTLFYCCSLQPFLVLLFNLYFNLYSQYYSSTSLSCTNPNSKIHSTQ